MFALTDLPGIELRTYIKEDVGQDDDNATALGPACSAIIKEIERVQSK